VLSQRYLRDHAGQSPTEPDQICGSAAIRENLSGDKDQQYFTDGMTDELIAHLAKIRSLRVISRTSSMDIKAHTRAFQIARDLNVDAVVEHGVAFRKSLRITAELVHVATDRHLWAETYESQLGDILTLTEPSASASL